MEHSFRGLGRILQDHLHVLLSLQCRNGTALLLIDHGHLLGHHIQEDFQDAPRHEPSRAEFDI